MRALLYAAPAPDRATAELRAARMRREADCLEATAVDRRHCGWRVDGGWWVEGLYVAEPHLTYRDAALRGLRLVRVDRPLAAGRAA